MKTKYTAILFVHIAVLCLAAANAPDATASAIAAQPRPVLQDGAAPFSTALPQVLPHRSADSPTAAAVQRVSTIEVLPYIPFATSTSHIKESYSGAMGSVFTFDVGSFGAQYVSNLTYVANAGVTCSHDLNLLITCSGSISQVTIDFDYTYIANDYIANTIWWGYNGSSNYDLEYTFHLIFPAPLIYLKPYSLEPISVTANKITWYQASTQSLAGAALFLDPRVQVNYLPVVMKFTPANTAPLQPLAVESVLSFILSNEPRDDWWTR